jgi:hypothetical protein
MIGSTLSSSVFYEIHLRRSWYGATLCHTRNIISKIGRLLHSTYTARNVILVISFLIRVNSTYTAREVQCKSFIQFYFSYMVWYHETRRLRGQVVNWEPFGREVAKQLCETVPKSLLEESYSSTKTVNRTCSSSLAPIQVRASSLSDPKKGKKSELESDRKCTVYFMFTNESFILLL